jgi:hypothetical protein
MTKKKIIAFYLPQYHSIPENDEIWGKGFTEWNTVKGAKKYYEWQSQPRVPLNENYYSLLDEKAIENQTKIAKEYGVDGFAIYHYWFSGKKILNKPLELIRDSKKINFPYMISWANESWTDAWKSDKPTTFLKQKYGNKKEWKEHYEYLSTFFKDPNYIQYKGKPLFIIYKPEQIPHLKARLNYMNELAINDGFSGISFGYQQIDYEVLHKDETLFDISIEYEPTYANFYSKDKKSRESIIRNTYIKKKIQLHSEFLGNAIDKILKYKNNSKQSDKPKVFSFESRGEEILKHNKYSEISAAGFFTGFDDTPRRQERGSITESNPDQFDHYLQLLLKKAENEYDTPFFFINAWNEWGEGAYLEPDEKNKYSYLEAIKKYKDK